MNNENPLRYSLHQFLLIFFCRSYKSAVDSFVKTTFSSLDNEETML